VNAIKDCSMELWHKQLSHLSEKGRVSLAI